MSESRSPDEIARSLVRVRTRVPGGPYFIELTAPGGAGLALGPYQNPATAHNEAKQLIAFLTSVLRQAAPGGAAPA